MGSSSSTLTREVLRQLVKDTQFTAPEVRVLHRYFRRICTLSSKDKLLLGPDEFTELFPQSFNGSDGIDAASETTRDSNRCSDSNADFEGFVMMLDNLLTGNEQEKMDIKFKLFEVNDNRSISTEDTCQLIDDIHSLHSDMVSKKNAIQTHTPYHSMPTILEEDEEEYTTCDQGHREQPTTTSYYNGLPTNINTMRRLLPNRTDSMRQPLLCNGQRVEKYKYNMKKTCSKDPLEQKDNIKCKENKKVDNKKLQTYKVKKIYGKSALTYKCSGRDYVPY